MAQVAPERLVVAADLGGTRLRVAAVDPTGQILVRRSQPTRAEEGGESVLDRLEQEMAAVVQAVGRERVQALAVAVAGPVNPWTGVVHTAPNLPGWHEVPLKTHLEARLGLLTLVGNDANLAALGEQRFGVGRGAHHLVYLTVSTGIGGGIIHNGQLLLGAEGLAGEVGHMTVDPDGPRCGCGNFGCLEALASGSAIARRMVERLRAGEPSAVRAMVQDDLDRVTAEVVVTAARLDDPVARSVMAEAARYLGIGVASLVHLFNPECVIIGGGVANAGPLLFLPVEAEVQQRVMLAFRRRLTIRRALLGDDVGVLGAAALAFQHLDLTSPPA